MGPAQAADFLGGALGYAAALSAAGLGLARLAGLRPGWPDAALALATLFAVFLAIHPFPDPARLNCDGGGAGLLLEPFAGVRAQAARLWSEGRPLADWLGNRALLAAVMNMVLFAPAGAALALRTRSLAVAGAFGIALSLVNELSQLTALWGIYPCRYRHFAVDDLILNPLGVLAGFVLMRRFLR